jgi:hypothetical protein
MTQYARPDSDVSAGSWVNQAGSGSNLYQSIDESGGEDDSDYVISTDDSSSSDTMEVGLSDIVDPVSGANHIVRYRAKGSDPSGSYGIPDLTVSLRQGTSTEIATATNSSLTTSFADYNFTLSSSEANAITDYSDLRLRFVRAMGGSASETNVVSEAWFETPSNFDFKVGDRVKETTTTTGTGTISLAGAVDGYQTFVAGVGSGNYTYYVIESGNNWEVGIGLVTDAATDTLTRATIISSNNSDNAITLAGTSTVFCGSPSRMEGADYTIKSGTYTADDDDSTILCDTTSAWTLTLPTAGPTYLGVRYLIKKMTNDANALTISSGASDFIAEGGTLGSTMKLFLYGDFVELQCMRNPRTDDDYIWAEVAKGIKPHVATVTQTSQQTIANKTLTQVTFDEDTIERGADADHSNNKILIKRAGLYRITGYIHYTSLDNCCAGAVVMIGITPDGGALDYYKVGTAANWSLSSDYDKRPAPQTSFIRECAVDDAITLYTYQDDGSSETTLVSDNRGKPFLEVEEIR